MGRNKRDFVGDEFYSSGFPGMRSSQRVANSPSLLAQYSLEAMYRRYLTELCMTRFEWKGFDDSVNVTFLEKTLFRSGLSIFYKDERFGGKYLALKGLAIGQRNMEEENTAFQVVGNQFAPKELRSVRRRVNVGTRFEPVFETLDPECVPIYANSLKLPEWEVVETFAQMLADAERSMQINSRNLRQPKVAIAPPNQTLTAVNIARSIDAGEDLIQLSASGGNFSEMVSVLDMGADPDALDALGNYHDRLWARCMMFLGINNGPAEKAERVQTAEVNANNEQVASGRYIALTARQRAAERINEVFGLNVSVDYRVVNDKKRDEERQADLTGDVENGDPLVSGGQ